MSGVILLKEKTALKKQLVKWLKEEEIDIQYVNGSDAARDFFCEKKDYIFLIDLAHKTQEKLEIIESLKDKAAFFLIKKPSQASNLFKREDLLIKDFLNHPLEKDEFLSRLHYRLIRLRHYNRQRNELNQLDTLFKISSTACSNAKLDNMGMQVLQICSHLFGCESAALYLNDETNGLSLLSSIGMATTKDLRTLMQKIAGKTLTSGQANFMEDFSRFYSPENISLEEARHFKSLISLPLKFEEEPVGVLEFYSLPKNSFKDKNFKNFLFTIGAEVGRVVHLMTKFSHILNGLQNVLEELTLLSEIRNAISSTINLDELLQLIVRNALHSFSASVVSLMLLDKDDNRLKIRCAEGLSPEIIKKTSLKIGEGIAGKVARSGQPLLLVDMPEVDQPDLKDIKSALLVPLKINDEVIGVLNVSKTSRYRFTDNDLKLCFNMAGLAAQAIEKAALYQDIRISLEEVKDSYLSTVQALANAIEAKDIYTQGHVERVAKYGMAIAMELDPELLKNDVFRYALILHDVGKIGVPDHILSKDGPLTDEEMDIIRMHPDAGAKILSSVKFLREAVDVVRYHQERYDGKGYPKGLKGEDIPLFARIVAVADTFDAITSDRPYRKARDIEFAKKEIIKHSGTQFDDKVVNAFITALDKKIIP